MTEETERELPPPGADEDLRNFDFEPGRKPVKRRGRPSKKLAHLGLKLEPETLARVTEFFETAIDGKRIKTRSNAIDALLARARNASTAQVEPPPKVDLKAGRTVPATIYFQSDLISTLRNRAAAFKEGSLSSFIERIASIAIRAEETRRQLHDELVQRDEYIAQLEAQRDALLAKYEPGKPQGNPINEQAGQ